MLGRRSPSPEGMVRKLLAEEEHFSWDLNDTKGHPRELLGKESPRPRQLRLQRRGMKLDEFPG